MAKQSKATIQTRKAELVAAGYSEAEINNGLLEKVENATPKSWEGIFEDLKKKKEDEKIPLTEGEHIPNDPDPVPPAANLQELVIRVEREAETGISTFDANKAKIAEWKKEYSTLKFTSLEDTETNNKIVEGWRLARTTRLALEKREDFLKAPFIAASKKIGGVAAEYYTLLAEIEKPMKDQRDAIEAAKEEEKNKAAIAAEAEGNRRVEVLKAAGMKFGGMFYEIGETISVDYATIKAMPEEEFTKFLGKVQAEMTRIKEALAEELKQLQAQRLASRRGLLVSIGMDFDSTPSDIGDGFFFTKYLEGVQIGTLTLTEEPDDKFMILFESLTNRISAAKNKEKEEAEKKIKERTVALRTKLIIAAGLAKVDWIPGTTQTGFYFKNDFFECKLPLPEVESMTDDAFDRFMEVNEQAIIEAKANAVKKEEADRKAAQLASDRGNQLIALGMTRAERVSRFVFNQPDVEHEVSVDYSEMTVEEDQWNQIIKLATKEIKDCKEAQQTFEANAAQAKKDREEKEAKDALAFQERQYQLVNLGMVIVAAAFILKNEFDDIASISIEEVKGHNEDTWPRRLSEVTARVEEVKALTISKRQQAIDHAEALKPEIQRAEERVNAIWDSIKDTGSSNFNDESVGNIYGQFYQDIYKAVNNALHSLGQLK